MANGGDKVVWVLGAGFSKPLGGPLLNDLLTSKSLENVRARWPQHFTDAKYEHAVDFYDWGRSFAQKRDAPRGRAAQAMWPLGEAQWEHAEEFLDTLDALSDQSQSANPIRSRLESIANRLRLSVGSSPSLAEISASARRLVAAECTLFTDGAAVTTEKWQAYREWTFGLGGSDTIITYNYDRVLEIVGDHCARNHWAGYNVPTGSGHAQAPIAPAPASPLVLKLHGSIDWKRNPPSDGIVSTSKQGAEFALDCTDDELAVATPGPSKQWAKSMLRNLWSEASKRIREASAVVFMGFRFPPSDATVLQHLTDAIVENDVLEPLRLHVVLGPQVGDPANVRVAQLLRFAGIRRRERILKQKNLLLEAPVHLHPLFAQDFMTLSSRDMLLNP